LIHRWATIILHGFWSLAKPPPDLRGDLNNASQLTSLEIFYLDLEPVNSREIEDSFDMLAPLHLPNLLSLRVGRASLPVFKVPSLRRFITESSWCNSGKYIWTLLASTSQLESIEVLGLATLGGSQATSWQPDPNDLSLRKLKHFASTFSHGTVVNNFKRHYFSPPLVCGRYGCAPC